MNRIHKLIFALAIATVSIIVLYNMFGDTHRLVVSPKSFDAFATKDASQGGLSEAEISFDEQGLSLNCDLKESSYAWPYCGVTVHTYTDDATKGMDLSSYHTIRLKIRYEEAGDIDNPNKSLRIYLRNYNPAYSKPDNEYTIKYNGIQFAPSEDNGTITIPINNLQVMTWWLADNKVPIEHSAPEYTNITRIDLATGAAAALGKHKIIIEQVEFEGEYIALDTLLYSLLGVWVMLGLVFTSYELHKNKLAYQKAQQRQQHLEKLNQSLKVQNYEIAELAHRDALTGALNRHAAQKWLDEEAGQLGSQSSPLTMQYLDLDHFKSINDTFGHQMGDDILREFVMVVASTIDDDDRLVRWGGEEFVVFCPGTNIDQAIQKAERIRKNVANHVWVHGEPLTCCIGVSQLESEHVTEAMARADEALYQAKVNGRNRVEVNYGSPTEPTQEAVAV